MGVSRRDFIELSTSAAVAGGTLGAHAGEATPMVVAQAGQPSPMGFDPADPSLKYELVIAGGEALDPSQKLRRKCDIGIKHGQIAAMAAGIPAGRAVQRIDASGKLVTPGLIDLHTHVCPHLGLGLPADEFVGITATTTAVSAGDAGAHTFERPSSPPGSSGASPGSAPSRSGRRPTSPFSIWSTAPSSSWTRGAISGVVPRNWWPC